MLGSLRTKQNSIKTIHDQCLEEASLSRGESQIVGRWKRVGMIGGVRYIPLMVSHEYNLIFQKNKMSLTSTFNPSQAGNIFMNSPCYGQELANPSSLWDFKPFVECENSIKYISQFLDLKEELPEITQLPLEKMAQEIQPVSIQNKQEKKEQSRLNEKKKKIQKPQNSPFHNYQKHLNNALKKLIIVPEFNSSGDPYKKAAWEIWCKYLEQQIKTKRILHYIFNENNQHPINNYELRAYNLWEIHQTYGVEIFNKAKTFLSKLAIDQIDEENIEGYLKTRKLKRHEGFKEYILQFRQELSKGYLKRRVNSQQMQN